ncbi:hypothetical protein FRX31_002117 [Thalictrum thalictroides]|uniref:ZF-HD dimerization-type domain-containing protein n=1 Tax=Thalictrum thalictroides TaxID=46969 RepID=A0A7J6XER9_THATH|nr:hypothetical protein FRX31_002117 [Thalictrum thalictroides]
MDAAPIGVVLMYKECIRNLAGPFGLHVTDGCEEFEYTPETNLFCAGCGCHISYHNKILCFVQSVQHNMVDDHGYLHPHLHGHEMPADEIDLNFDETEVAVEADPVPVEADPVEVVPEEVLQADPVVVGIPVLEEQVQHPVPVPVPVPAGVRVKGSKYTVEEIEQMRGMANFLGWKMPGREPTKRQALLNFCQGMGITKENFKSWLHNQRKAGRANA